MSASFFGSPPRPYPRQIKVSTRHKNPNFYVRGVCRILESGDYSSLELTALELATVIAMDAALALEALGVVRIKSMHTSYVTIKSRITGRFIQRAQLVLTLVHIKSG